VEEIFHAMEKAKFIGTQTNKKKSFLKKVRLDKLNELKTSKPLEETDKKKILSQPSFPGSVPIEFRLLLAKRKSGDETVVSTMGQLR